MFKGIFEQDAPKWDNKIQECISLMEKKDLQSYQWGNH